MYIQFAIVVSMCTPDECLRLQLKSLPFQHSFRFSNFLSRIQLEMRKSFLYFNAHTHPAIGSDIIAPYKTLYSNYVNLYIHTRIQSSMESDFNCFDIIRTKNHVYFLNRFHKLRYFVRFINFYRLVIVA